MSILFTITGILFALLIAFLFSFNKKLLILKTVYNDNYSSLTRIIYDAYDDRLNYINYTRSFFEGLIKISNAGINFVLVICKITTVRHFS